MPIYEYRCKACHQVFEKWCKSFDDNDEQSCPICNGDGKRIMSSPAFVLKGGGWYATEYGNRRNDQAAAEGASSTESAESAASSAPAESAPPADASANAPGPAAG